MADSVGTRGVREHGQGAAGAVWGGESPAGAMRCHESMVPPCIQCHAAPDHARAVGRPREHHARAYELDMRADTALS